MVLARRMLCDDRSVGKLSIYWTVQGKDTELKPPWTGSRRVRPRHNFLTDLIAIQLPRRLKRVIYEVGAGNRVRTGDLNLGKVALYQLSYSRESGA